MTTKNENPLPKKPVPGSSGLQIIGFDGQTPALPGAVCVQYKRCGKPGCRCAGGELHGPYHYHFWRVGGRLFKRYVRPADLESVRASCAQWRGIQDYLRMNRRYTKKIYQQMNRMLRDMERGSS